MASIPRLPTPSISRNRNSARLSTTLVASLHAPLYGSLANVRRMSSSLVAKASGLYPAPSLMLRAEPGFPFPIESSQRSIESTGNLPTVRSPRFGTASPTSPYPSTDQSSPTSSSPTTSSVTPSGSSTGMSPDGPAPNSQQIESSSSRVIPQSLNRTVQARLMAITSTKLKPGRQTPPPAP